MSMVKRSTAPAAKASPAGKTPAASRTLSDEQRETLLETLRSRFDDAPGRHPGLSWTAVQARLVANPDALASLHAMERTGGEPDALRKDAKTGAIVFVDCAPESPSGRRSLCYDRAALDARKENKPKGSAMEMARQMGVTMLTEAEYRGLQTLGGFDAKTSSWVQTPPDIRARGGALFCDLRYGHVFTYHNGAESYYAARGFRGMLRV